METFGKYKNLFSSLDLSMIRIDLKSNDLGQWQIFIAVYPDETDFTGYFCG